MNDIIYNYSARSIEGKEINFSDYKGKVLLIVNVASNCGFTPQYSYLQKLYKKYKANGFEILAFPCNQFGKQDPGSDTDIKLFCEENYNVSFQLFAKADVNGKNELPLFTFLKHVQAGALGIKDIKWNFTKFLIDRKGNVVKRYAPSTTPEKIENKILELLNEQL